MLYEVITASLKQKGHKIDYVEISGRPNHEVMEELGRSDIRNNFV